MKKQQLKNLQLHKKFIANLHTSSVKGGLSGTACENPEEKPSENPMESQYRSVCIGCEVSNGIIC